MSSGSGERATSPILSSDTESQSNIVPFGRGYRKEAACEVNQLKTLSDPPLPSARSSSGHAISQRHGTAGDYVPDGDDRAAEQTVSDFAEFTALPETFLRLAAKLRFANPKQADELVASVARRLTSAIWSVGSE